MPLVGNVDDLNLGAQAVQRLYVGNNEVWPAVPALAAAGWSRPDMTGAQTVVVSGTDTFVAGNGGPVIVQVDGVLEKGLFIEEATDVLVVGGHIKIDLPWWEQPGWFKSNAKAVNIKNCTGTVHLEGLYAEGAELEDFIYINSPTAVVKVVNCRAKRTRGQNEDSGNYGHADVLQVYGCKELWVDGLSGTTGYQGMFIHDELGQGGDYVTLRRVFLEGIATDLDEARWMLALNDTFDLVELEDVYVKPSNHPSHNTLAKAVRPQAEGGGFVYPSKGIATVVDGRNTVHWPGTMTPVVLGRVNEGDPPFGDPVPYARVGRRYEAAPLPEPRTFPDLEVLTDLAVATGIDPGTDPAVITMPTEGLQDGDLVVVAVAAGGTATIVTPEGFSLVDDATVAASSNNPNFKVYTYIVTDADSMEATATFDLGSAVRSGAIAVPVRGAEPTGPIDVASSGVWETGTTGTISSATTTVDNCLLLAFAAWSSAPGLTITPPESMTAIGSTLLTGFAMHAAYEQLGAAGETGTRDFTSSLGGKGTAGMVAIRKRVSAVE